MFSIDLIAVPDFSGKEHHLMASRSSGLALPQPHFSSGFLCPHAVCTESRMFDHSDLSCFRVTLCFVESITDPVLLEYLRFN